LERLKKGLESERRAIDIGFSDEEKSLLRDLHLLTMKKILYIANVRDDEISRATRSFLCEKLQVPESAEIIPISAKIEQEISLLPDADAQELLKEFGLKESGLNAFIRSAYHMLHLMTYFTAGPKEIHAWNIVRGWKTPQAAGVIHSDFERGFIAAEVISYEDFVACGGEVGAREKGRARIEGKEYVVQDGDVMHFRFNV